jgi:UV DNA damage endonuclease
MIRIGYACINTQLPGAGKTFRLSGYSPQRMLITARANLTALENILNWNLQNNITLYRITSDLIPFGSHKVNSGVWRDELAADFLRIGRFVQEHHMRVSLHPGQYSILNSPNTITHQNTLNDLEYHTALLDLMGLTSEHKIILHGGGVYSDKSAATEVLIDRLRRLPLGVKHRLALENDERSYNAGDILAICEKLQIPAILDVFHQAVNPGSWGIGPLEFITRMNRTWKGERQKIHYSNQKAGEIRGSHSGTIQVEAFKEFYDSIKHLELDIMLEVKDKQESVLKLRQAIAGLG